MKTENLLSIIFATTLGIFVGVIVLAILIIPEYKKEVNRVHYADKVIEECAEQYDDFYDTIAEGDAWSDYIENRY